MPSLAIAPGGEKGYAVWWGEMCILSLPLLLTLLQELSFCFLGGALPRCLPWDNKKQGWEGS